MEDGRVEKPRGESQPAGRNPRASPSVAADAVASSAAIPPLPKRTTHRRHYCDAIASLPANPVPSSGGWMPKWRLMCFRASGCAVLLLPSTPAIHRRAASDRGYRRQGRGRGWESAASRPRPWNQCRRLRLWVNWGRVVGNVDATNDRRSTLSEGGSGTKTGMA